MPSSGAHHIRLWLILPFPSGSTICPHTTLALLIITSLPEVVYISRHAHRIPLHSTLIPLRASFTPNTTSPMLGSITATNELKDKKKVLKKAKKLGRDRDDYDQLEEDTVEQFVFVDSCSTPSGEGDGEKRVGRNTHESLDSITEKDVQRSSSSSTSTSSDAGGQWAIASAHPTEPSRKGKVFRTNRQAGENIPPSPTVRRQSLDLSSRGSASSTPDLKRSTSLWHHQQPRAALSDDAAGEFQDRYLRNFGTGTMSDRRRTLNVKRARKMAQACCVACSLET